jgi:two-component system, OmpR family, response regulator MprA
MEIGSGIMLVSGPERMGVEKIREALFKAGYKVAAVEADSLKEAIGRQMPALVIANLTDRPACDLEMCQRINRLTAAPIVAIGSSTDEAFRVGLIEMFVDDFISRPVSSREFLARVRSILRRTQLTMPCTSRTPPGSPHIEVRKSPLDRFRTKLLLAFSRGDRNRRPPT